MGLPSILNSTVSMAASSKQSLARIWRWSGRGCTVMPSAPAAMHMRACAVTLGLVVSREFRISAILLRLTLSAIMGLWCAQSL